MLNPSRTKKRAGTDCDLENEVDRWAFLTKIRVEYMYQVPPYHTYFQPHCCIEVGSVMELPRWRFRGLEIGWGMGDKK